MTVGTFETPLGPNSPLLSGSIRAELREEGGVAPVTIIRADQDWIVNLHWDFKGSLTPMICGQWCIHLYAESMGPGPELELHPYDRPNYLKVDPCGNGEYYFPFEVAKGKITAAHCSTPYKLIATVTLENECDRPCPVAGFVELPVVQFYQAK